MTLTPSGTEGKKKLLEVTPTAGFSVGRDRLEHNAGLAQNHSRQKRCPIPARVNPANLQIQRWGFLRSTKALRHPVSSQGNGHLNRGKPQQSRPQPGSSQPRLPPLHRHNRGKDPPEPPTLRQPQLVWGCCRIASKTPNNSTEAEIKNSGAGRLTPIRCTRVPAREASTNPTGMLNPDP
jgi:hypothetical protein